MADKGPQDDGIVAEITSTPDMTDERTALNRQLDGYIDASATEQKDWTPFRDSAVRMLLDDQLAGVIIREGWGRVQLNKIYPAITQEQAIHVQRWQNSDIAAKPMGAGDPTAVKQIEGRLRYHYFKNIDIPGLMLKNIMEADVGGEFVNKPYWDGEAEWDDDKSKYRGRVKVDLLDIQQFVIDPECGADLTKARYMGTHMRKELDWALDRWPDERGRIILAATSEAEDEKKMGTGAATHFSRVDPLTDVTMDGDAQPGERGPRPLEKGPGEGALANMVLHGRLRRQPQRGQEAQREGKPRFITILEIYFLDFEKDKSGKRLYPFGRMILRVGTGVNAIVLNDAAVKQPDDEEAEDGDPQRWWMPDWPFLIGILRALPGDTWRGMDSVVMLRSIQEGINSTFAHLDMGVRLFSDPIVMAETDALELTGGQKFKDKLRAVAGAIWELAPNALRSSSGPKIRREPPPPLSADLYRVLDILIQHLSDTSGVHEVTRGSQSKGKATATEILQLQTNSRLRVGSQSWYADRFVVALLTMVMRIEMDKMSEKDEIEIIDEDGTERREKLTQLALELDYGIEIRVVTALPWDAERSRELAMQLLEVFGGSPALAKVVLEEFKKVLPSLNVGDVIVMMKAAQREQQQAEADAAAAKAGPAETPAEEPIDLGNEAPDAPA